MKIDIQKTVIQLQEEIIGWRREFHQYPEVAWTEFRTADRVIKLLNEFGYNVHYGDQVVSEHAMMGVPSQEILEQNSQRAIAEGADLVLVGGMAGGKTGVVGIL